MSKSVDRVTVDLAQFPDLVVIYLGMRVRSVRGLSTLLTTGRRIRQAVAEKPDGLLLHERMIYSLFPPNIGMRQYWRNFESLEAWSRSMPHHQWWAQFLRDSGGTGFWHEAYFMRGGMEAVYDDVDAALGFSAFARTLPARGAMFSARDRAKYKSQAPSIEPAVPQEDS
jgi:hypothetical protein